MIDIQFDINTAKASFDIDTDFMPMLVITGIDGKVTVCALAVNDPAGYLSSVLASHILSEGPIESVSFTSDTYYSRDSTVERPLSIPFLAGDPRVTEALAITRASRGKGVECAVCPYLRTPDGVEWGIDHFLPNDGLSGRVVNALRAALGEYQDIPLFNQGENP